MKSVLTFIIVVAILFLLATESADVGRPSLIIKNSKLMAVNGYWYINTADYEYVSVENCSINYDDWAKYQEWLDSVYVREVRAAMERIDAEMISKGDVLELLREDM